MVKKHFEFDNSIKSYILILALGFFTGVITRLSDFFQYDTLWSFSSIATLFGFWITTVTLVVYFSSSNTNAGINAFLYLFMMSLSFYVLKYLLGLFLPRFENEGFQYTLFLLYSLASAACGLAGYVLYFWNKGKKAGSMLYALPVGALAAETAGTAVYLINNGTFLFQLVFDFLSLAAIGIWFYGKASHKAVYVASAVLVASAVFVLVYMPFIR